MGEYRNHGKYDTLYAFIDENGEYYRGESANYYHIRLWHSEEAAIRYVKQYRAPGKPALTMVRLTAVPVEEYLTEVTTENRRDEIDGLQFASEEDLIKVIKQLEELRKEKEQQLKKILDEVTPENRHDEI